MKRRTLCGVPVRARPCTVGPNIATLGVVWIQLVPILRTHSTRPFSETDEDDGAGVWCGGVQASWRGGDEGE